MNFGIIYFLDIIFIDKWILKKIFKNQGNWAKWHNLIGYTKWSHFLGTMVDYKSSKEKELHSFFIYILNWSGGERYHGMPGSLLSKVYSLLIKNITFVGSLKNSLSIFLVNRILFSGIEIKNNVLSGCWIK